MEYLLCGGTGVSPLEGAADIGAAKSRVCSQPEVAIQLVDSTSRSWPIPTGEDRPGRWSAPSNMTTNCHQRLYTAHSMTRSHPLHILLRQNLLTQACVIKTCVHLSLLGCKAMLTYAYLRSFVRHLRTLATNYRVRMTQNSSC